MPTLTELARDVGRKLLVNTIRHALNKYGVEWIVIHETLQNSIDAIDEATVQEGNISIELDVECNEVLISDNGCGFPHDLQYLVPNLGLKSDRPSTKGYAGIGLKAVIFSSTHFNLVSYRDGMEWQVQVEDPRSFLSDNDPEFQQTGPIATTRTSTGTTCRYRFPSDEPRVGDFLISVYDRYIAPQVAEDGSLRNTPTLHPRILRRPQQSQPIALLLHALALHFRNYSYAACLDRLLNVKYPGQPSPSLRPITVNLRIKTPVPPQFFEKHRFLAATLSTAKPPALELQFPVCLWNLEEALALAVEGLSPAEQRRQDLPLHISGRIENGVLDNRYEPSRHKVYTLKVTIDHSDPNRETRYAPLRALLGYNPQSGVIPRSVRPDWDAFEQRLYPKVLGLYITIGTTKYNEILLGEPHGRQRIFARGYPTAHDLSFSSTSSTWYNAVINFSIDVDAKCEDGKKHLTDTRLITLCRKYYQHAYSCMLERIAKSFVRKEPARVPPEPTILVDLPAISLPGLDFKRIPITENALIGLFYQYLTNRNLSLPTFGISPKGRYDGKFVYSNEGAVRSDNDLLNLEFKVNINDLLEELEDPAEDTKSFPELDLIVVWLGDLNEDMRQRWRITGIDDRTEQRLRQRGANLGMIHSVIYDIGAETQHRVPIIVMKDVLEELMHQA